MAQSSQPPSPPPIHEVSDANNVLVTFRAFEAFNGALSSWRNGRCHTDPPNNIAHCTRLCIPVGILHIPAYYFLGSLKWTNVVPFAKERLQKAGQTKKEHPKTRSFCGGTSWVEHNTHINIRWAAATLLPAALPYIFIETYAIAANHGAVASHESITGARWSDLLSLGLVPLSGAPKHHPSKYRVMGGASALSGHHLMDQHNNQMKDGVGGGGNVGE